MKPPRWQVFSLLYRYPEFGRLWTGRLVSLFGDAFALIALPWFVLQVTGSGTGHGRYSPDPATACHPDKHTFWIAVGPLPTQTYHDDR